MRRRSDGWADLIGTMILVGFVLVFERPMYFVMDDV